MSKIAVIAGAGPAGLTAALELLRRSGYRPVVFDLDSQVGGISKTINYRGNHMDLGGHRFFSKSDWVMNWWQDILPVAATAEELAGITLGYQGQHRDLCSPAAAGRTTSAHAGAPPPVADLLPPEVLRLPTEAQQRHVRQPRAGSRRDCSGRAMSGRECRRASRRRHSRISSSIASATGCTSRSSRTTRRRSGACRRRDLG